ncbi:MAG: heavy-metal-associated domain-containing protein [Acidobacteriota bacterium]
MRHLVLAATFMASLSLFAADAPAPSPAGSAPAADAPTPVEKGNASCTLSVPDMHCSGCARGVVKAAKSVDGVKTVEVRLDEREVDLTYDDAKTDAEAVRSAVSKVYDATIKEPAVAASAGGDGKPADPPPPGGGQ